MAVVCYTFCCWGCCNWNVSTQCKLTSSETRPQGIRFTGTRPPTFLEERKRQERTPASLSDSARNFGFLNNLTSDHRATFQTERTITKWESSRHFYPEAEPGLTNHTEPRTNQLLISMGSLTCSMIDQSWLLEIEILGVQEQLGYIHFLSEMEVLFHARSPSCFSFCSKCGVSQKHALR